jgi:hypothetical protein
VVCDRCNNGKLSVLDQALVDFHPIKMTRAFYGIQGKTGKRPQARFTMGTLGHDDNGVIDLTLNQGAERGTFLPYTTAEGDPGFRLNTGGGRRLTPKYSAQLAAALLKMGLEAAHLDHGTVMLAPQFDHVRAAIVGQPTGPRNLVVARLSKAPRARVELTYFLTPQGGGSILVGFEFYGIALFTHSLHELKVTGPFDANSDVHRF